MTYSRVTSSVAAGIVCLISGACGHSTAPPATTANATDSSGQRANVLAAQGGSAGSSAASNTGSVVAGAASLALPEASPSGWSGATTAPLANVTPGATSATAANPARSAAAATGDTATEPPGAGARNSTESAASAVGSTHQLVVQPMRFVPAQGTGFPTITVDATGKVSWGDSETASVVENAIVFSDGARAATWLDDNRIVVAGWAETFKFTHDGRIEGEQGLRIAIDHRGLASVADPTHHAPAHSIGRFDALTPDARPLAELLILVQQVRHPPIPEGGATATSTPHLYVFHPTRSGEKATKPATNQHKGSKKPVAAKKKPATKKKSATKKKG
jgi:hypothetical protein